MRNLSVDQLRSLLGVAEDATPEEVDKAYKRASLIYHPDKPGGDNELFRQITVARDILKYPSALARYEKDYRNEAASHRAHLDSATYRAQFTSYRQWFEHSLRLVQTVRSYRRSFISFRASDSAADALLSKLENKSASFTDVQHFLNGEGAWEPTSTKTLFFELLHGPVSSTQDKKIKAITWLASLSDKRLEDNPTPECKDDLDFFVRELKAKNARKFAIEIELGYLSRYLTGAEFSKDPLVTALLKEQDLVEKIMAQICAQIHMCNTAVKNGEEQGGPLSAELTGIELKLIEIAYQYALLEMGYSEHESIEMLREKHGSILRTQKILWAERTKVLEGDVAVMASGGDAEPEHIGVCATEPAPATPRAGGAGSAPASVFAGSARSTRRSKFFKEAPPAAQASSAASGAWPGTKRP